MPIYNKEDSRLNFVVYAYLRKSDYTPYYIGKGRHDRVYAKAHNVKVPTDLQRIIIIEQNLTDLGACAIERQLIRWYGRKDINTGILRNMTDGGDGTAGYRHTQETKNKISIANTGRVKSEESRAQHAAKIRGRSLVHSGSFVKGMTPWSKGKKMDTEYSNRCSAAQTKRFTDPEQRKLMKSNSEKGKITQQQSCLKLVVRNNAGRIETYLSIGEFCKATDNKSRLIYHHATKNAGKLIKYGKFQNFQFWLVTPATLNEFIANLNIVPN